jgi:malate dehydrogenase (oxaloacetate-decarboxylating)(NADP+)
MDDEKRTFTDEEALAFHRWPTPGKIAVHATKPMATQRDLSLAYSPGVAVPVLAIAADPDLAYEYTSKGNLVAVITNGTAILGLGDLGALAAKPVWKASRPVQALRRRGLHRHRGQRHDPTRSSRWSRTSA